LLKNINRENREGNIMTKSIAKIGHNSGDAEPQDVGGVAGKRLLSFLERIEKYEEEKSEIARI